MVSSIQDRSSKAAAATWRRLAFGQRRDPIFWLIASGCILVAAICVGTMIMIGEFRERALKNGERELENTVMLLTRHFEQQFEDSEAIAVEVIGQMKTSGIDSPEIFKRRMSTPEMHELLHSKVSAPSYIGDIAMFDADGTLLNWSRSFPPPRISIADRPYFKIFKTDPQSEPIVAEPARSYVDGNWTTIVAHRLNASDGTLLGVVTRRIDPANYERFFASLALGEGAAISMFHSDGTMLARYPHVDALIGRKFKDAPLVNRVLAAGGQQTLRVKSPVDGLDRLGAAAQLGDFPIVVVATNTVAAALTDWRAQTL